MSDSITRRKNRKLCWNESLGEQQRRRSWWRTFSAAAARRPPWPKSSGRKWIATDLGKFAIHTTRKRLIQVQRELKAGGKPFRAFEVLNLGRYERQAYLNVAGRLTGKKKEQALARKEQEFRDLILKAYRAEPLRDAGFFHGKTGGRLVVVGPINLPVGRLFVEEVITECRKRGATRVDVLAFEFEMGLVSRRAGRGEAEGH